MQALTYGISRATQPEDPLTLTDIKRHVLVEIDDHDQELLRAMRTATELFEKTNSVQLMRCQYRMALDEFPMHQRFTIKLPVGPAVDDGAASIEYRDTNGFDQTLDATRWQLLANRQPAEIALRAGQTWPAVHPDREPVVVVWTAGYADTRDALPPSAVHCVLLLTGHFFENREATSEKRVREIDLGAQRLLRLYEDGGRTLHGSQRF